LREETIVSNYLHGKINMTEPDRSEATQILEEILKKTKRTSHAISRMCYVTVIRSQCTSKTNQQVTVYFIDKPRINFLV